MAEGRILVVAPQFDMRRSLEFVLDAEGFEVASRSRIDFAAPGASARFDCIVLDHQALAGPRDLIIAFCARAAPVVLVASKPIAWLSDWVSDTVEKPVKGGAITSSVKHVLASRTSVPTK